MRKGSGWRSKSIEVNVSIQIRIMGVVIYNEEIKQSAFDMVRIHFKKVKEWVMIKEIFLFQETNYNQRRKIICTWKGSKKKRNYTSCELYFLIYYFITFSRQIWLIYLFITIQIFIFKKISSFFWVVSEFSYNNTNPSNGEKKLFDTISDLEVMWHGLDYLNLNLSHSN